MKSLFTFIISLLFSFQTQAQYTTIYENSFRNYQPGNGWIMLNNDTVPTSPGLVLNSHFGGVPTPFYLEIYDYMLGVDQTLSATDKYMISPPFVLGSNSYLRFYSSFNVGAQLNVSFITNPNDTNLPAINSYSGNSIQNGFNIYDLSSYANDTIRFSVKINGLVSKAFIDNLLLFDKYSLAYIPDSCFRSYLQSTIPSAFIGDSLNFISSLVYNRTSLSHNNSCIKSLEGLQYFLSLTNSSFYNNLISYIPPDKLTFLVTGNFNNNKLRNFPDAPLCTDLYLGNNLIRNIPDLKNDYAANLYMKNNLVYDCLKCSNRFIRADLSNNIYTTHYCNYYNLIETPNPGNLTPPLCERLYGHVKGKVYYDMNANSIYDSTDILLKNQRINVFQGTDVYTAQDGTYIFSIDSGIVQMSLTDLPNGFICNSSLNDTIDVQEVITKDFIVNSTSLFSDLGIHVNSTGTTRLKENLTVSLSVKNYGTQTTSGLVKMFMPNGYTLLQLADGSILNDTLSWSVSLKPFESKSTFILMRADSFPVDTLLKYSANISVVSDSDTSNNFAQTELLIRDSLVVFNPPWGFPDDPNNKLVNTPIVPIGFDDYLTYNINFENIGTANATRVMVRDYLSSKLDITTFEFLSSSHPCDILLGADSIIQFLFQPIVLTPKDSDALHCQGNIWFRIKPTNPIGLNDTIYNSAGIYFDLQDPVLTNASMVWADTIHGVGFSSNKQKVCQREAINFFNRTGGYPLSLEWQFPGGTPSTSTATNPLITYNNPGSYDVMLVAKYYGYNDTLFISNYVNVTYVEPAVISILGNVPFCPGDSVLLSAPFVQGASYTWYGSFSPGCNLSQNAYLLEYDNVKVRIIDTNGCISQSPQQLIISYFPPNPIISGSDTICSGDSTTFTSNTFVSYLWSTGSTTNSITPINPGLYYLTVTDNHGCKGMDSINFVINNLPSNFLIDIDSICLRKNSLLTTNDSFSSYSWSNGSTSDSLFIVQPGIYILTVTDSFGCVGVDSIKIISVTNQVNINDTYEVCIGATKTIDAGPNFLSYLWSTNDTTQQINILNAGIYTISVVDSNGCVSSDTTSLIVNNLPNPIIFGNDSICNGSQIILNGDPGYFQYVWSSGHFTPQITISDSGLYTLSVIDTNGCRNSTSHYVNLIYINSTVSVLGNTLIANSQNASYQWMYCDSAILIGQDSSVFQVQQSGSYALIVYENGCIDTSACIPVTLTSLNLISSNTINLYPNPVINKLFVELLKSSGDFDFELYSSSGNLIKKKNLKHQTSKYEFDLSDISEGMYFVIITNGEVVYRYKIIKQF